jgi:serine protease Do
MTNAFASRFAPSRVLACARTLFTQRSGSTEGYTGSVNSRQHPLVSTLLTAALVLGTGGTALAQGAPAGGGKQAPGAAPKAAPKQAPAKPAKPKAPPKADDIDPVEEEAPEVKAQRGIVVLQRAGQPLGLGVVLGGDGRILSALSPLGSGTELEAKFADDTVHKVKLGHHDRIWDLALLVPQSGKWTDGLSASSADPLREDATIRAFSAVTKGKPTPSPVDLRSRRSLIGGDDQTLANAIELGSRVNARDLGSPLIDEKGRVVGVLGRACLPIEGKPCSPVAFGIPVPVIKSFLKSVPPDAVPPMPWLGVQGVSETTPVVKGVRLLSIAKNSPAATAKLKAGEKGTGDLIVAVAGSPVTSPEELASAIKKHAIGEKVPITVFNKSGYRNVDVVLRAPPDPAKPAEPKAKLVDKQPAEAPAAAPKKKGDKPAKPGKAKPKAKAASDESEQSGPPTESDPFSEQL